MIARQELRLNDLRVTKFGHKVCLQDYMVPTVHVSTKIFPFLLKELKSRNSRNSQDRSTGHEKGHSVKITPIIGREGNVLLLETIMAGLDRTCVNLIGQVGIGKSAFLHDVENWWVETGFMQHHCFIATGRQPEAILNPGYLLNLVKDTIAGLRIGCHQKNGSFSQSCDHRVLIIIDDLDAVYKDDGEGLHNFQKELRRFIRRSRNVFFIVSSVFAISCLSTVAIPHELLPLQFADALSLASKNLALTEENTDMLKVAIERDCFEELVLFCAGNPLAITIMTEHIKQEISSNNNPSMASIFSSFIDFKDFHIGKSSILKHTESINVKALWNLLFQAQSLDDESSNEQIQSYSNQTPLGDCHVSMDLFNIQNISTRQALILSLGIFCGTLPCCLEPCITALYVQQRVTHSSSNSNASEVREILHKASMKAMVENDKVYMQLQQLFSPGSSDQLEERTSHEADAKNEWMDKVTRSDLKNWISKPVEVIYGDDNWSWRHSTCTINPVLTLILRAALSTCSSRHVLREEIRFALGTVSRSRIYLRPKIGAIYFGTSLTSAVGADIDNNFLNELTYASSMQLERSLPISDDLHTVAWLQFYPYGNRRRLRVLIRFCDGFARLAAKTILERKLSILSVERREMQVTNAAQPVELSRFCVLEYTALRMLVFTLMICAIQYWPIDDLRSVFDTLMDKPFIEDVADRDVAALWKANTQDCLRLLDRCEGKLMINVKDDLARMKERSGALRSQGHNIDIITDFDARITPQTQLMIIDEQHQALGGRLNDTYQKMLSVVKPLKSAGEGASIAIISVLEDLLEEEVQTFDDPLAKVLIFRTLASWNTVAGNLVIAANHQ